MKNPKLGRFPTPAELYAIEAKARRIRAAETARLLRAGAAAARAFLRRLFSVRNAKGLRHA
jgi:hypothetical protein